MTIKVHFDGKVFVPDEPVDVPVNQALRIQVLPEANTPGPAAAPANEDRPLMRLARALENLPSDPDAPTDGAAQHDHYLYGHPKHP